MPSMSAVRGFSRSMGATALLVALASVAACGGDASPAVAPRQDTGSQGRFEAVQQRWRAQRLHALTAPDGMSALVGLHWLGPGPHFVGAGPRNGIRLAAGPAQLGMVDLRPDGVRFTPERGVAVTLDGVPVSSMVRLRTDADPAGAGVLGFDDGRGQLTVIRRGARHALRVRHADAATRTGFAGLAWWPGGPDWVVQAHYTAHPAPRTLEVADIVGTVTQVANPGMVTFQADGRLHRLELLEPGPEGAWVAFVDRTSGHGSYGIGRYLDVAPPPVDGPVVLDFNRAYNPPCAFTAFSTCRLPPTDNRLDLHIPAGEKAYLPPAAGTAAP